MTENMVKLCSYFLQTEKFPPGEKRQACRFTKFLKLTGLMRSIPSAVQALNNYWDWERDSLVEKSHLSF